MKDWIKRKLDEIDRLFPAERLNKSKERWTRVWTGEKPIDRYPFNLSGGPLAFFNPYNINHEPEDRLRAYLDGCIFAGQINDDLIPSIFPGCNQATIPSMFGAAEIKCGIESTCEKIINSPEDIDKLPEPSIKPGTTAHKWLDMQEYLIEETEGRIPVHVCDMQGPIDVCGQIWGYDNLFISIYEEPEYFHKLLTKISDAFTMLWKAQQKILGDCFVGTHLFAWDWVPKNNGATLSADSLVMVSPGQYDEYYKPYFEKIGHELGGLSVHSCGNFSAVVKNLCATSCIKAINASQLKAKQLIESGLDKSKVIISLLEFNDLEDNMRVIRENEVQACISIPDVWPQEEGKKENPGVWTREDWKIIRQKEEKVTEIMSII